ncbi:hypothetical protein J4Q44_G00037480 [Coregonus suidteri]|uniref:SEA domain-containing protein n=1 Tax=Coregonus suidteri TaxID=861788 RepID=A0AAN8NC22_9TELE
MFKTLAAKVVSEVNRVYARTPSFRRSIVNSFRSGSVVTNMTLVFDNKTSRSQLKQRTSNFHQQFHLPEHCIRKHNCCEGTLSLQFSLNQTFNSDLSNPSSSMFKTLAAKVVSEVNRVYARTPSFRRSIVNSFRSGSVVTNMTLVFDNKTSVPSSSSAQATFTNSSTSLNIVSGSTIVDSSATSGSAPRPTAFSLAALPLSLALLMVQLLAS